MKRRLIQLLQEALIEDGTTFSVSVSSSQRKTSKKDRWGRGQGQASPMFSWTDSASLNASTLAASHQLSTVKNPHGRLRGLKFSSGGTLSAGSFSAGFGLSGMDTEPTSALTQYFPMGTTSSSNIGIGSVLPDLCHQKIFRQKHGATTSVNSNLLCRVCGTYLSSSKNAARHRRRCENKCHLQCSICSQQFYRRDLYSLHMRTKHGLDLGPSQIVDRE